MIRNFTEVMYRIANAIGHPKRTIDEIIEGINVIRDLIYVIFYLCINRP
jgi:hypothetical protein